MGTKRLLQRKGFWWLAALCVVAVVAMFFVFRAKKPLDLLNVPLGVEQAAIVTYSGPAVTVTPYKWGVAVNVRIAKVTEQPDARIYDVRYIVNRAGTFDLKDYLMAEDGSSLSGLPSFKFQGDPKLSKSLDARIQETEEIGVDIGGHYYATLTGLAVLWIVWLLLLIFWGRTKPAQAAAMETPPPTFAEMLRHFLAQLEAGTLDAAAKAKMEMLLLQHWRQELGLAHLPMSIAFDAISRGGKTEHLLRQLEDWLHRPASNVRREDIAALLASYATEPTKPEAMAHTS